MCGRKHNDITVNREKGILVLPTCLIFLLVVFCARNCDSINFLRRKIVYYIVNKIFFFIFPIENEDYSSTNL